MSNSITLVWTAPSARKISKERLAKSAHPFCTKRRKDGPIKSAIEDRRAATRPSGKSRKEFSRLRALLEDELRGQLEDSGCDVRGRELEREISRIYDPRWRQAGSASGPTESGRRGPCVLRAADAVDVGVVEDVERLADK